MYWLYLGAAIALEIAGTISMKFSQGFTRLTPSILMVVFYLLAFTALNFSLKQIDVSVAYAIWSGLGTAVIAVIGYLYFNESMSLLKAGSIVLIILGVIGLNLSGGAHGSPAGAQAESTPASKHQAQD
ncbi:DMT family transporter [Paenibacillus ehimensis]|uniref:Multidrug efflux SMR transporter n=1 Tax=Paenibacillus ehimensis TaxID=79264 RepID=A0ABT8VHZ9_9BACL|nr:multidrug efflux SMR transporter [Paenibacillus ehimensis]MDO3680612.1 multidrug efflux SMR transporter [Paenibacillus ehimensis]MEC0212407.1 multidrug efflux SMR transporter [Paenibacillus ehimensis]